MLSSQDPFHQFQSTARAGSFFGEVPHFFQKLADRNKRHICCSGKQREMPASALQGHGWYIWSMLIQGFTNTLPEALSWNRCCGWCVVLNMCMFIYAHPFSWCRCFSPEIIWGWHGLKRNDWWWLRMIVEVYGRTTRVYPAGDNRPVPKSWKLYSPEWFHVGWFVLLYACVQCIFIYFYRERERETKRGRV